MNTVKIETIFDLMKNKEPRGFELLYEQHFRIMSRELSEHGRKKERRSKNCVAHVWIIP